MAGEPVILVISTHILTRRMTLGGLRVTYDDGISTHILTRRMTAGNGLLHTRSDISTHILTRRMTLIFAGAFDRFTFQLTSSQGG